MHGKGTIICAQCGDAFTHAKGRGSVYCSRACMTLGMRARNLPEDRFWAKVEKSDGCWLWRSAKDPNGYGRFKDGDKTWLPHRWLWTQINGPLDAKAFLCHTCHVPGCVRPSHLYVGDPQSNVRDMIESGRAAWLRPDGYPNGKRWGSLPGEANPNAKLTDRDVQVMRYLYWHRNLSPSVLASWFGLAAKESTWRIVNRHTWKHVPDLE